MTRSRSFTIALSLACALLVGCATSRSEITLDRPGAKQTLAKPSSGRVVVIRSVKDERTFEEAPRDPSIPSLGFEGAAQASAEVKLRAVGRKRNTFGKALGDVLLQRGRTVEDVIRENLAAALEETGHQVVEQASGEPSALVIDVRVTRFWAWARPGFWAITLNADIVTSFDISGTVPKTTLSVHAEDSRQFADDAAWIAVIDKALQAYRERAAQEVARVP